MGDYDLVSKLIQGVAIHELVRDNGGKIVNYRVVEVNPAFSEQTKIKSEQVVGKLATEAYGTEKPPYLAEYVEAMESEKTTSFDSYFEPIDKHFSISVVPLDEMHFATVFQDVTYEWKRRESVEEAKKMAEESEKRLRTIFEHTPRGMYMRHLSGKVVEVNREALDIFGYSREEVLGHTLSELNVETSEDISRIAQILEGLEENQLSEPIEVEMVRKSGEKFTALVQVSPVRLSGEKILFGLIDDLTKAQEQRMDSIRFRQALEHTGDVVMMTDLKGKLTYVNPKFCEFYGYMYEEVVGKQTPAVLKAGGMSHEDLMKFAGELMQGKTLRQELENVTKEGKVVKVVSTASAVINDEGKPVGSLIVQRDVSEERRVGTRMKQETEAILKIARLVDEKEMAFEEIVAEVTELMVQALGVERASYWELSADNSEMKLVDLFGKTEKDHSFIDVIDLKANKPYYESLKSSRVVQINDLNTDERTKGLERYGRERMVASCLDAGVMFEEKLVGVVSFEATEVRDWKEDEARFASEVADQITRLLVSRERNKAEEVLRQRTVELEKLNKVMIGRELRMVELKKEIGELRQKLGMEAGK